MSEKTEDGIELRESPRCTLEVPPQTLPSRTLEMQRRLTADHNPRHVLRIIQSMERLNIEISEQVRPHRTVISYFEGIFSLDMLIAVVSTCTLLLWVWYEYDPTFHCDYGHADANYARCKPNAYATILGIVICVLMLVKGWSPWIVFVGFVAVLAAFNIVEKQEILDGFSKDGAWIPQFLFIIISAIRESGVLEEALQFLLGTWKNGRHGRVLHYLRLQFACAMLGLLVGAGPAITTAAPVIKRWAVNEGFDYGPPLILLVVSATCGSVMLISSSPISIVIRDIMTAESGHKPEITATFPVACVLFVTLSFYSLIFTPGVGFGSPARIPASSTTGSLASSLPRSATTDGGENGQSLAQGIPEDPDDEEEDLEVKEEQERAARLKYKLEFVVRGGSSVIGLTPQTVGIRPEDGIELLLICRSGSGVTPGLVCRVSSRMALVSSFRRNSCAASAQTDDWQATASDPEEIKRWTFEAGDVMVAQCSVQGVIAMRKNPGVFALRGLHCNKLLGGRRHMRRLYECVVAHGSPIVGRTLEDVLNLNDLLNDPQSMAPTPDLDMSQADENGISNTLRTTQAPTFLKEHLGYPLAAFRRRSGLQAEPLSFSHDVLTPGDVVLVDAFEDFPTLQQTAKSFLVVSLVPNSQAPRHGRNLDKRRGILAICLILGADLLVDVWGLPLLKCTLLGAIICVACRTVQMSQVFGLLSWPMLLTFGAGTAVSRAIAKTGVANAIVDVLKIHHEVIGGRGMLVALSILSQLLANTIGNAPAGLVVAPLATEIVKEDSTLWPDSVSVLVVITCNMALSTPFGTGSNFAISSLAGFSPRKFLRFGLPAQAIVTVIIVWWTYGSLLREHPSNPGSGATSPQTA